MVCKTGSFVCVCFCVCASVRAENLFMSCVWCISAASHSHVWCNFHQVSYLLKGWVLCNAANARVEGWLWHFNPIWCLCVCALAPPLCVVDWLSLFFFFAEYHFFPLLFLIKRSEFPRFISRREISLFFSPSVFNLIFRIHSVTSTNRCGQNSLLANCMSQKQREEKVRRTGEGWRARNLKNRRSLTRPDVPQCPQQQPFNTIRPLQPEKVETQHFLTFYQSVADYPIIEDCWKRESDERIWSEMIFILLLGF